MSLLLLFIRYVFCFPPVCFVFIQVYLLENVQNQNLLTECLLKNCFLVEQLKGQAYHEVTLSLISDCFQSRNTEHEYYCNCHMNLPFPSY